jgi:hypothetical protein
MSTDPNEQRGLEQQNVNKEATYRSQWKWHRKPKKLRKVANKVKNTIVSSLLLS